MSGFDLRLIVDGSRYLLTLKDTTDPGRFGFNSDEGGVIVKGAAVR